MIHALQSFGFCRIASQLKSIRTFSSDSKIQTIWYHARIKIPEPTQPILFSDELKVRIGNLCFYDDIAMWAEENSSGDPRLYEVARYPYWTHLPSKPTQTLEEKKIT